MQDGRLQRARDKMYTRMTEIILGVLLTVAVSAFAYTLNAQAQHSSRLRDCETATALNTERINGVKEALKESQADMSRQFAALLSRVDQRCDTLESILNLIAGKAMETEVQNGLPNSNE